MPAILLYLVKLSCALGLTWLFYRLVLHSLTFYTLNRWYLLGYTLLSFLMPLIDIGPIRGENTALQPVIVQYIPVIGNPIPPSTAVAAASRATHWDAWNGLLLLLLLGSCFLLLRFLARCYSLRALRRRAVLLQEGPINIYQVREPISPFSFGNAIYINPGLQDEKEREEIILHEYVHIRQRHTLDILFGELLVIAGWYNPFAWLIRYSIRQNLEFIADRAVVDNGFDKKGYQYHLLKVVGQNRYKLANNFNFSSLKKRIIMMNKMKSTRLHLLRFLFVLPLLTVLLVAFRNRFPVHPASAGHPQSVAVTDTVPRKPDTTSKPLDYTKVLWIVDGVPKPRGWNGIDSIRPENIAAMNIYKRDEAIRIFGENGVNGVIYVITKAPQPNMPIVVSDHKKTGTPLYVIDGTPVKNNALDSLDPHEIESITVIKDVTAKAIFGEKAANGAILIKTKNGDHPHIVAEVKDANGNPITITADTMTTPQGKFYPKK